MCEIAERIERRGERRGMRRGISQGIADTINQYINVSLAEGQTTEDITRKIQRYFALTPEQARNYMQRV